MTHDDGMDVSPSWQDLARSLEISNKIITALQDERDALSAQVEELKMIINEAEGEA